MVVRIHNTSKWRKIESGNVLHLAPGPARRVRIEVNCVEPTRFDAVEDGVVTFLAVVQGLETIEFTGGGDEFFFVPTSGSEVFYFTNDGDDIGVHTETRAFVKMMRRQARNPELERMMWKSEQRMKRALAQQADEFRQMRDELIAQKIDPDTGEDLDDADSGAADQAGVAAPEGEAKGDAPADTSAGGVAGDGAK